MGGIAAGLFGMKSNFKSKGDGEVEGGARIG